MKRFLLFFVCLLLFQSVGSPSQAKTGDALRYLPVQDAGRLKPFDSFSREMLEIIYGKTTYENREAYEVVLTWMLLPSAWQDKKIFEVRNFQVLESLKLSKEQRYFSGDELFTNDRFSQLRQELQAKRETKEKLNPYFQALQRIENQFLVFREIASGRLLKMIPPKEGRDWIAVADFDETQQAAFLDVTKSFVHLISAVSQKASAAEISQTGEALDKAVHQFEGQARASNPGLYPSASDMKIEVHYNDFHPFRWAYIFYVLAALVLMIVWILDKKILMRGAWVLLLAGP